MSGLIPVRHRNGAPYNGAATRYFVPATDSNAMYLGDVVAFAGSADTSGKYATVALATLAAGNPVLGPIVGVELVSDETKNTDPSDERVYRAASTAAYVWVADDPDLIFKIKEDAAGAALEAADVGNIGIAAAGGGGSTVTGRSSLVLDSSDFDATTANAQYRLLGLEDTPDNALGSGTTAAVGYFLVSIHGLMHQNVSDV